MTASKTMRRLEREFWEAANALRSLDAGQCDHLFADAETKAAMRADICQLLDGYWKRVLPLRRPELR